MPEPFPGAPYYKLSLDVLFWDSVWKVIQKAGACAILVLQLTLKCGSDRKIIEKKC